MCKNCRVICRHSDSRRVECKSRRVQASEQQEWKEEQQRTPQLTIQYTDIIFKNYCLFARNNDKFQILV
nr:hypothetical transcript [Hymenolepis microstoma]